MSAIQNFENLLFFKFIGLSARQVGSQASGQVTQRLA